MYICDLFNIGINWYFPVPYARFYMCIKLTIGYVYDKMYSIGRKGEPAACDCICILNILHGISTSRF